MGKSSPKAPEPPDPKVTAAAQTQSNIDTANANANLNRVNQNTPWGSQTYSRSGAANPDGTYQWTLDTKLSPDQQYLLDAQNNISKSLANIGQGQLNNLGDVLAKPLDMSRLAPTGNANVSPTTSIDNVAKNAGAVQSGLAPVGGYAKNAAYGSIQSNLSPENGYVGNVGYGNIQDNLNLSNVPGLVGGDALSQAMKDQQKASFDQQKAYLDPQFEQQQRDLENKLVQQGIMQNSDAWNRAMGDFSRQRTFAYDNANRQAVGLGNAAQAQLYGQGLSSNQNAFSQALGSGQFANSAQSQGFGQALQNAGLNNDVVDKRFAQKQAMMAAGNAAQAQGFGQSLQNANLNNDVINNQFAQNQAAMAANNAAQAQRYGQGANTNQMEFAQGGQNFDRGMALRNQGLNELLLAQSNPLNQLNALRTGAQVTSPTFAGNTQNANIANTDTMSPVNNAFNAQMGAYNAQVAQNNATTGALGNFAGSALMAF